MSMVPPHFFVGGWVVHNFSRVNISPSVGKSMVRWHRYVLRRRSYLYMRVTIYGTVLTTHSRDSRLSLRPQILKIGEQSWITKSGTRCVLLRTVPYPSLLVALRWMVPSHQPVLYQEASLSPTIQLKNNYKCIILQHQPQEIETKKWVSFRRVPIMVRKERINKGRTRNNETIVDYIFDNSLRLTPFSLSLISLDLPSSTILSFLFL